MKSRIYIPAAILVCGAVFEGQASAEIYDAAKVVAAMGRVNPRLKIIISHRGIYGPGCPENTTCSISRAAEADIEAVEIDVKETKDGVPWPSHDLTVGRGTTYNRDGRFFSPFENSAANEANNPLVSALTEAQLKTLELRDIKGDVVRNYTPLNLKELVRRAAIYNPNIAFVFDIKYPQSVKKIAQIVKDLRISDRVVLKFLATFFLPARVGNETLGVAFAPTLYAGSLDAISDINYVNYPNRQDRLYLFMKAFSYVNGFKFYEMGNKMLKKEGSAVDVQGPLATLTKRLANDRLSIANFIPVIENRSSNSQFNGFYNTFGHCCVKLTDYLTKTKYFGNETRDDRWLVDMQVRYNENVITDNAVEAKFTATVLGSRQDVYQIWAR
jgi:hypothetical protein